MGVARKLELVMSRFPSQSNRYWYTEDTFTALMRLRGVEARSPTGYAEAFFGQNDHRSHLTSDWE